MEPRFRLPYLFVCAVVLSRFLLCGSSSSPNLVLLLADDYGWGDPSPPLGVGPGLTPELNAMAASKNAVVFPRGYIGGSVCSPSRAAMLTGRSSTRDCIISVDCMGNTIADILRNAGYATLHAGKWHLGSLSNSSTTGCYTNATCLPGYVEQQPPAPPGTCCEARDGHLPRRTPLDFGFSAAFSTSQVAPSSTSNCGCLATVAGAGKGCNLGHYAGAGHLPPWMPGLECMSTMYTTERGDWLPFPNVTAVDDAEQLVDVFEAFLASSVRANSPFFAAIWFHQTHIPYVAPPAFRAMYPNATPNEADYWGSASAMDAQLGRVRRLLAQWGVANTTLIAFTADNGPEVDPASGQGTVTFPNPGLTGGLSGRKRALLEGGIRVPFVVEAPWIVAGTGPRALPDYAASHMDFLPTMMDLLGHGDSRQHPAWPLDGLSLVPALKGLVDERPSPLGWFCLWPLTLGDAGADCPSGPGIAPASVPVNFSTPGGQPQAAWMEGALKLTACRNSQHNWIWRLFNVSADPAETADLLPANPTLADAMFLRFQSWANSVAASRTSESMCAAQAPSIP